MKVFIMEDDKTTEQKTSEIQSFLNELKNEYAPILEAVRNAWWDSEINGTEENFKKAEEASNKETAFFNNKERFEKIKSYYDAGPTGDELIDRQINVLYRQFLAHQGDKNLLEKITALESEATRLFNNYRAEVGGKKLTDNELNTLLKTSTDSAILKEAWEANKKQGTVVADIIVQLAKLRNEHAKNLGFNNYFEFSMFIEEQKADEIIDLFDKLHEELKPSFTEVKKEIDEELSQRLGVPVEELKPWHYQNVFFQEAPHSGEINLDEYYTNDVIETGRDFFKGIGLPIDDVLERSSLYSQEGKSQHAFAEDFNRKGDVRILLNAVNNEQWLETTLHELGHATYWSFMDRKTPYFIRETAHTFTTEAIAMMFGRLPKTYAFLNHYHSKPLPDGKDVKGFMRKTLRRQMLVQGQWMQVFVRFEKALYEDPDQDLNALWWKLVKEYQQLNCSRDGPDWASKIHFVVAAVYYHNYYLGELLASQMTASIAKLLDEDIHDVDFVGKPSIGFFLKEKIYDAANKYHWNEMIKRATGEELNPKWYIEQFKN